MTDAVSVAPVDVRPLTAGAASGPDSPGSAAVITATVSRIASILGVLFGLSILPLLSDRDVALSVYRARYAEGEVSEAALAAIRHEIGLDGNPFTAFAAWFGRAIQGDFGISWVTREPVLPSMLSSLGTSLSLMLAAFAVAVILAGLLVTPTIRRGLAGRTARGGGGLSAALTALPDFLLAAILLIVGAVWLGAFPPFGWGGPRSAVLPALAMGIPTGGFLGRLLSDGLASTFNERWVTTWQVAGYSTPRIVAAALRRTLPGIAAPASLALVSLTASAVVIEQVYAIPGIGRATLSAAHAQDLPSLQAGILLLMLLAVALGVGVTLLRVALLGPALRSATMPTPVPFVPSTARALILPATMLVLLVVLIAAGAGRDPYALDWMRLQPPAWELPFGADATGRDLLARVSHGALSTLGLGVVVMAVCLVVGLAMGLFPHLAAGPIEITNAAPPVLAGLIAAALVGPSALGAAVAVAAVSWAPLASHTAALVAEAKAQPHVRIAPLLGVGRIRMLVGYVLPSAIGPVVRHACLRLPGICLSLAALGFLGLGSKPPAPDWGLVLAEGMPYVERAPLLVLLPASALVILGVFAVSLSAVTVRLRPRSSPTSPPASIPMHPQEER
ncbi:MAG: ABC transporter permease subunit [Propioniciclava sp.]